MEPGDPVDPVEPVEPGDPVLPLDGGVLDGGASPGLEVAGALVELPPA